MEITIPYYEDNTRISNSSLGWFLLSPKYFRDMLDGVVKSQTSSAMETGSMIHMYLLQPEEFKSTYRILDFTTPSSAQQKQFCIDYINSKAPKAILKATEAFRANYKVDGKPDEEVAKKGLEMALKLKPYIKWLRSKDGDKKIISWSDLNMLKVIKENVLLHKKAKELLYKQEDSSTIVGLNEFHINWSWITEKTEDTLRTLPCKSLIDRLIVDHDNKKLTLVDIKTTVSVPGFRDSFNKYDYGRQMAYYWFAVRWYFENEEGISLEGYSQETYIVAIQNNGSYECRVFTVPESVMIEKADEIKKILTEIDWHMRSNKWDYSRMYYDGDGTELLLYDK